MNYYYLGASLPELSMEAAPSISMDAFRALASEHLSATDFSALSDAESLWTTTPQHPFVKTWKAKEIALRNALVQARAALAKKDPAGHLHQPPYYDADAEHAAGEAMSQQSPLEKEQHLDRHRWSVLDGLAGFNCFASESILAYSIKLGIATRWSQMDEDTGRAMADQVISTVPSDEDNTDSEAESISENNDKK
jgi:hypothetical protein